MAKELYFETNGFCLWRLTAAILNCESVMFETVYSLYLKHPKGK